MTYYSYFMPLDQYAYSPQCSQYISYGADQENLLRKSFVGDHFLLTIFLTLMSDSLLML